MIQNFLWVALGGALGSGGRYWVGVLLAHKSEGFPWATFSVNLVGSFCLGLLLAASFFEGDKNLGIKLFLTTGIMGGFTTYSTFSFEALSLFQKGQMGTAATYVLGTLLFCLGASWAGFFMGRQVF